MPGCANGVCGADVDIRLLRDDCGIGNCLTLGRGFMSTRVLSLLAVALHPAPATEWLISAEGCMWASVDPKSLPSGPGGILGVTKCWNPSLSEDLV